MQNKSFEEFVLLLKDLLATELTPINESSPVRVTRYCSASPLGNFRIREYAAYTGRSATTGKPVNVPRSFDLEFSIDKNFQKFLEEQSPQKKIEIEEFEADDSLPVLWKRVRNQILSGKPSVAFTGVGEFKSKSKKIPGGAKRIVTFETEGSFRDLIQTWT